MSAKKRITSKNLHILAFVPVLLLTLYATIKNYIRHYRVFHSPPMEIGDKEITELLNNNNLSAILFCAAFILFTALAWGCAAADEIKARKKRKGNADGKRQARVAAIIEIFLTIMLILFLAYLGKGLFSKISVTADGVVTADDWEISVRTVAEKASRHSGKTVSRYVILKGSGKKQTVSRAQYAVYIRENEDVYYVQDKKHGITMILSPNQYQYVGEKLDTAEKLTYTPVESSYPTRYYLRIAIICTIAFIIETLILLHICRPSDRRTKTARKPDKKKEGKACRLSR